MALAPIVRIAYELDRLVALELDELERTRANRFGAHVGGGHVAGVDRVVSGGKEGRKRRLRSVEVKDHLVLAASGYLFQVVPPELARVLTELVGALVLQLVEGADHILGRERFAVMPLDVG